MPFKEPNYTQFSNEALDHVMRDVSANCWKIICVAVRKTYGWHKRADRISYSQFLDMTGIKSKSTIFKAIQEALEKGILLRREKGNGFEYELNRAYVQKLYQYKNCTDGSTKTVPTIGTETVHTKEKIKDNKDSRNVFSHFQNNIQMITPTMADELKAAEDEYKEEWIIDAIDEAVKNNVRKWSYIKAILKNWKASGGRDKRSKNEASRPLPEGV